MLDLIKLIHKEVNVVKKWIYIVVLFIVIAIGISIKVYLSAEQPVKDVVITVPAFFNQAERRAMVKAAEIAGLNLLQV